MALGNDQNLNIVVRLQDQASKALEGLTEKLNGIEKRMGPAVDMSKKFALGLTAIGAAAVGFGALTVKAAMNAEVQMARVGTTITNTLDAIKPEKWNAAMSSMGISTDDLDDAVAQVTVKVKAMASETSKLGFDGEDAAESISKLFQRTGDLSKAQKLNATAMDLARSKNISLAEATDMVGMVLSGNGRVLKQYGIQINDSLSPLAQLDELQQKVGGSAESYSQTLQGQMDILSVAFGDLAETVGAKLIPVISKFLNEYVIPFVNETLPKWIENLQSTWQWLKDHEIVLMAVAGAIVGFLTPAIIAWGIAATTAFAAAAVAAAPWLIGGAIVGGIVGGIMFIVKNWDNIKGGARMVWDEVKKIFKEGVNFLIGLAEGFGNAWIMAVNWVISGLNKIKITVPDWVPEIGGKSWGVNIEQLEKVSLPRFEQGGIVPGTRGSAVPIIAHAGEQIIPARNVESGGNTYITVSINNPKITTQEDVELIRTQIDNAMRDIFRGNKVQLI